MQQFDTVVVSDLHLGARNSRTDDFLRFLSRLRTQRLVVAGDLFDSPRLRGMTARDVRVLESLRWVSRRSEVIWIRGNHDPSLDWFRAVFDVRARDEWQMDVAGRTYLVCHGHEWEEPLGLPAWLVNVADGIYRGCQWLDPTHGLARRIKRNSKWFCRAVDGMRCRAVGAARLREFDGVIVGHSHVASDLIENGVHYLNCGCWTERPAGFVGVRGRNVRQYQWAAEEMQTARSATRRVWRGDVSPAA
jgi:UDP-2,3-diacylglucosamine pyrophosphatase LpxH